MQANDFGKKEEAILWVLIKQMSTHERWRMGYRKTLYILGIVVFPDS